MITVKLLGEYREISGTDELLLKSHEFKTVGEILYVLPRMFEGLDVSEAKTARNNTFVDPDEPVADGDDIAVMPPVTGG